MTPERMKWIDKAIEKEMLTNQELRYLEAMQESVQKQIPKAKNLEAKLEHCFEVCQFRGREFDAEIQYANRKMLEIEAARLLGIGKSESKIMGSRRSSGSGGGKSEDPVCGEEREDVKQYIRGGWVYTGDDFCDQCESGETPE